MPRCGYENGRRGWRQPIGNIVYILQKLQIVLCISKLRYIGNCKQRMQDHMHYTPRLLAVTGRPKRQTPQTMTDTRNLACDVAQFLKCKTVQKFGTRKGGISLMIVRFGSISEYDFGTASGE